MNINGTMMQYFEWYLEADAKHWNRVIENASELSENGFTALWLPPAYKGQAGINDVGYGVYDVYDLGEFNQKGSIATKYGTKEEYLQAICALHEVNIQVYGDIVFNHKMGADGVEEVEVVETEENNRNVDTSDPKIIEAWTKFNFPERNGKYSSFIWNESHFSGVDFDQRTKKHSLYRFDYQDWDQDVDQNENGNYDYLMGADLCFSNQEVVEELDRYGQWYLTTTNVDGFRLDALKHIDFHFFEGWLARLRKNNQKELFTVGEYWSPSLEALKSYLDSCHYSMSLFDVPLHFNFFNACNSGGNYDMSKLLDYTLVKTAPCHAVTFVENHDTQRGQALETVIADWFKPLAYAVILLRDEGYPCVFYGDYYGIPKYQTPSFKLVIDKMMNLRKHHVFGERRDYFDDFNIVGWTMSGDESHFGCAVLINDGAMGSKKMMVNKKDAGKTYVDYLANCNEKVIIDEFGEGIFKVNGGSVSVWVRND